MRCILGIVGAIVAMLLGELDAQKFYKDAYKSHYNSGIFRYKVPDEKLADPSEKTLKAFLKKNPDLECTYEKETALVYGELVPSVKNVCFIIKSLANKYQDDSSAELKSLGYQEYNEHPDTLVYYGLKALEKLDIEKLFNERGNSHLDASPMQLIYYKIPRKLNPNSSEYEIGPIKEDVRGYARLWDFADERKDSPLLANRIRYKIGSEYLKKALSGTLLDLVEHYSIYGEGASPEVKERLKLFLFHEQTNDTPRDKELRRVLYEYAYQKAQAELERRNVKERSWWGYWFDECYYSGPFFARLASPYVFPYEFFGKYDPCNYAMPLGVKATRQNYERIDFNYLEGFVHTFGWVDHGLKRSRQLEHVFSQYERARKLFYGKLSDEDKALFDQIQVKIPPLIEKEKQYWEVGYASHQAQRRESFKRARQSQCEQCEIDDRRSTYPSIEEGWLGGTYEKDGKIYMKNGEYFNWRRTEDRRYEADVTSSSFFFSSPGDKYKTFSEMLDAMIRRCKQKYCN